MVTCQATQLRGRTRRRETPPPRLTPLSRFPLTYLLALPVKVDERIARGGDVLRRHALVHAVDVQVEAAVGVHQKSQHRPLRTRVQIRAVILTYLRRRRSKRALALEANG